MLLFNNKKGLATQTQQGKKGLKLVEGLRSEILNLKSVRRLGARLKNNRLNRRVGLRLVYRSNNLFIHIYKNIFRRIRRVKPVKVARSYFYASTGSFGFKNAMKSSNTTIDKVCDRFIPYMLHMNLATEKDIPGRWKKRRVMCGLDLITDPYKSTRWLLWLFVNRLKRSKFQPQSWLFCDHTPFGGTRLKKRRRK